ncbi:translation initiation factor IF-2 [Patescibacteria group bacterium]|nr:translation initiation factor IF-2 [Patescibacteria group bacterium]
MNLSELARKLKITTEELKVKLPELGFDIGKKAIKIDESQTAKIIQKFKEEKRKKLLEEKIEKFKNIDLKTKTKKEENKDIIIPENKIFIGDSVIVSKLAEKMNVSVIKIISELMKNGIVANLNQAIDFDTASIIAEELGYSLELKKIDDNLLLENNLKDDLKELIEKNNKDFCLERPPVVVVMGHVDHGKTKLLDTISDTNKIKGESGGITQHIGAFQIEKNDRKLTFIDTPGHEAFQSMRARGGEVADVAILIVAANDSLKAQTLEAIKIIQEEKLPFIVAINKIDLPDANIDKVKNDLSEINLTPEDWGGDTICVSISALKGNGIDELLDVLFLVSDIYKEKLNCNSFGPAMATIIESHLNENEGPKATVIIQTGTLRKGDYVLIDNIEGKIKSLKNDKNEFIDEAKPGDPVIISGLRGLPKVGDILQVINNKKELRKKIKDYTKKTEKLNSNISVKSLNKENNEGQNITSLNLIIKSDFLGSKEALTGSLEKINQIPNLKVNIIKNDVGSISEGDVLLAEDTKSIILGFGVHVGNLASMIGRDKNVVIKTSKIIYELIDFVYQEIEKLVPAEKQMNVFAKAKVLKVFSSGKKQIFGCLVDSGFVKKGDKFYLKRNDEIIAFGDVKSLKIEKKEYEKVEPGNECGILSNIDVRILEGDLLEFYEEIAIPYKIEKQ